MQYWQLLVWQPRLLSRPSQGAIKTVQSGQYQNQRPHADPCKRGACKRPFNKRPPLAWAHRPQKRACASRASPQEYKYPTVLIQPACSAEQQTPYHGSEMMKRNASECPHKNVVRYSWSMYWKLYGSASTWPAKEQAAPHTLTCSLRFTQHSTFTAAWASSAEQAGVPRLTVQHQAGLAAPWPCVLRTIGAWSLCLQAETVACACT